MIDLRALATDVRTLAPLSSAVIELTRLTRVLSTPVEQIERIMLRDPALSANVLRVANSPVFGLRRQVRSLSHAVTLLGFTRVRDLITSTGLMATLPAELPGYGITAREFLSHSIAVGVLAEQLANRCLPGRDAPWFLAGLLHDIGKLVLSRYLAERSPELSLRLQERRTLEAAERSLFSTDHTEVAAIIGRSWQLPPEIIAAATHHHTPAIGASTTYAYLVDVVHVADVMAYGLGFGSDVADMGRELSPEAVRRLQLKPAVFEEIASNSIDTLNETCRAVASEEYP